MGNFKGRQKGNDGSPAASQVSRRPGTRETDGEGITHITVVGDIVSVVLADSVGCAYFVADCMAFVDSVSYCRYCRGGVSCSD